MVNLNVRRLQRRTFLSAGSATGTDSGKAACALQQSMHECDAKAAAQTKSALKSARLVKAKS